MPIPDTITYGPFRTPYHQQMIDSRFEQSVADLLSKNILPLVTNPSARLEVKVGTDYDHPRYLGPLSICKYDYHLTTAVHHKLGSDDLSLAFSIDPLSHRIVKHTQVHVHTAAQKRKEQYEREESKRRAAAQQARIKTAVKHLRKWRRHQETTWKACVDVWQHSNCVTGAMTGPSLCSTAEHRLCVSFARKHPNSHQLVHAELANPNPYLAAYAFKVWVRINPTPLVPLTPALLQRTETVYVQQFGCEVSEMTLGHFFKEYHAIIAFHLRNKA